MSRVVALQTQKKATILFATDSFAVDSCDIQYPTDYHIEFKSPRRPNEIISLVNNSIHELATLVIPRDIDLKLLEEMRDILVSNQLNLIVPIVLVGNINTELLNIIKNCRIFYTLNNASPNIRLPNVLSSAISEYIHISRLYKHRPDKSVFGTLLKSGSFEFRTLDEATQLSNYLAASCPSPRQAALGLSELFVNAIEHGNLGITYDEKSYLIESGKWIEEIEKRLGDPKYSNKTAFVHYERKDGKAIFHVKDEGNGFDWKPFYSFSKERLSSKHGRGIAVAKETVFSELHYSEKGNEVTAIFDL